MNNPWSTIQKPSAELNVRLVDETHPLKLFWGVDAKSRYSFAYDAPINGLPQKKSLPSLSGVELYLAAQGARGKNGAGIAGQFQLGTVLRSLLRLGTRNCNGRG